MQRTLYRRKHKARWPQRTWDGGMTVVPSVYTFRDSVEYLNCAYLARNRINPKFSLRAWARQLNLPHAATLSSVLRRKRPLNSRLTERFIANLKLHGPEADHFKFLVSLTNEKCPERREVLNRHLKQKLEQIEYQHVSVDLFRLIADWKKILLLEWISSKGFDPNIEEIRTRFGEIIGKSEIRNTLALFERLGLAVLEKDGRVVKTGRRIASAGNVPDADLRALQGEFLGLARKALDVCPVNEREVSTNLVVTSKSKVEEAKRKIIEFRRELTELMRVDDGDTVYALNIALFEMLNRNASTKSPLSPGLAATGNGSGSMRSGLEGEK